MSRSLSRLSWREKPSFFVEEERLFGTLGQRIRDVRVGPDGFVYLLTDEDDAAIWRLRPAHRNKRGRIPFRRHVSR